MGEGKEGKGGTIRREKQGPSKRKKSQREREREQCKTKITTGSNEKATEIRRGRERWRKGRMTERGRGNGRKRPAHDKSTWNGTEASITTQEGKEQKRRKTKEPMTDKNNELKRKGDRYQEREREREMAEGENDRERERTEGRDRDKMNQHRTEQMKP